MKLLQLTTIIRDAQTATMRARSFARAPVLVGRQDGNHLRLDAAVVSRRHGAFLFSKDGLQFIDYGSANGTYVDGARIAPYRAVDIRDSSVITIVPFQIVASLNLVDARRLVNDPEASTPATVVETRAPARLAAVPPSVEPERARRAMRIVDLLAHRLLAAGSRTAAVLSPLRLATSADEIVALLLDPAAGDQRFDELDELLGELLVSHLP
jgi:pSer/pThr/pTyr-binding forkhead associated (FHA) protein